MSKPKVPYDPAKHNLPRTVLHGVVREPYSLVYDAEKPVNWDEMCPERRRFELDCDKKIQEEQEAKEDGE